MTPTPQATAPLNPFTIHRLPLTQPEIAEQFGTTQQYVQRVEMGLTRHAPGPYSEYLEELRGLKPGQLKTEYHQYALSQRQLLSPIKEPLSETFHNPRVSAAEIVRRAAQIIREFFYLHDLSQYSDANLSADIADEMVLGQTMKLSTMTFTQWAINNSPNVPPNILAVLKEIPTPEPEGGHPYESGPFYLTNLSNVPQED